MIKNYHDAAATYHECRARFDCLIDFERKRVPEAVPAREENKSFWDRLTK